MRVETENQIYDETSYQAMTRLFRTGLNRLNQLTIKHVMDGLITQSLFPPKSKANTFRYNLCFRQLVILCVCLYEVPPLHPLIKTSHFPPSPTIFKTSRLGSVRKFCFSCFCCEYGNMINKISRCTDVGSILKACIYAI